MIFVFDSLHQINMHLFCVAGTFVCVYACVSECVSEYSTVQVLFGILDWH